MFGHRFTQGYHPAQGFIVGGPRWNKGRAGTTGQLHTA